MEIENKNRSHEATQARDKASRGNVCPRHASAAPSPETARERHRGERSPPDTETLGETLASI